MLKLLRYETDKLTDMLFDAQELFDLTTLDGSEEDKAIIKVIDRGTYATPIEFTDRFNVRRDVDQLSMGCKIALSVWHNPNRICNGIEAGRNAISAVIAFCREGAIAVYDKGYDFATYGVEEIDVWYNGYRFTSYQRLLKYMRDEWPYQAEIKEDDGCVLFGEVSAESAN